MRVIVFLLMLLSIYGCQNGDNGSILINGRIEADEINLAFKMPGMVKGVNVEEGDLLHAGEVIAELKSEDIDAKLNQAKFDEESSKNLVKVKKLNLEALENRLNQLKLKRDITNKNVLNQINIAENNLKSAKLKLLIDKNNLKKAKANFDKIKNDKQRFLNLYREKAISKQKYEEVETLYKVALSDLKSAKKAIKISEETVKNAENTFEIAKDNKKRIEAIDEEIKAFEKNIKMAEEDLAIAINNSSKVKEVIKEIKSYQSDSKIYAHSNILILKKFIQPGEVVAAGQPIVSAYEPSKIYFRGYLPEPYLGKVKLGMEGELVTDSFKDRKFKGKIIYISNKSEFTPKEVQTVGERVKQIFLIKVKVEDEEGVLKPGMPADYLLNIK